jgi:pyrimidine operon attenuation protein/uracil phosphoribosyltransferase
MQILNSKQIIQKIHRIGMEIQEQNHSEKEIILAGINNKGYKFACLLYESIKNGNHALNPVITRIQLNPADPLSSKIEIEKDLKDLNNKVVIIIDDVCNTGRTIFYSFKTLLEVLPKKVQIAVLVDRKHKIFPIHVDYYGMSLATTLKENIEVNLTDPKVFEVIME